MCSSSARLLRAFFSRMVLALAVHLKGFGLVLRFDEPGLDGSLEFGHALEDAAADLLAGDFGKQPLNQVDPGR